MKDNDIARMDDGLKKQDVGIAHIGENYKSIYGGSIVTQCSKLKENEVNETP